MEVLYPYNEDFRVFKTCRLCGSKNKENIDIFTSKPISPRSEDILTKILTVYPIVLYKDDPLPQHICPKCIGNVSKTYQGIQQVLRQQSKWLELTKAAEPENRYFRILNEVENSIKATKDSIRTSYNIAANNIPLGKFLASTIREHQNVTSPIKPVNTEDVNETVVKNIQNKLESNGFTIKRIKVAPSTHNNQDSNDITDFIESNASFVTCKHCKQKFSNLKTLAQHQLIHLKLNVNKSCTKNDDGSITCKICHKVFDNFRSSNSHMRKHKPPRIGPSVTKDKYNIEDDYAATHPSTSNLYYNNTTALDSFHIKPPRPPYRVVMTNGGIKTKIVQKRHDFLSNYAVHNRHPVQRSMTSSPDLNDDENLIVPELLTSAMKSHHSNGSNGLEYGEYGSDSLTPTVKSEPLDNTEYGMSDEARFCFICNENFSTSRDYELHAMFVHNIN